MMLNFKRKIHKTVAADCVVEVAETGGVRSLYLGNNTVQSSMRVKDPTYLELAYTRGMLGFLLFQPNAKNVTSIGLGGGSVAKYVHAFCPHIAQTVCEINAQVIAVARSHFYLPENDARLNVLQADGVAHLQKNPQSCDVLLIDAFDSEGVPDECSSLDFFESCQIALQPDGVMAMNLWGSDKMFDVYLQRIETVFGLQNTLILPTGKPGNVVVFGLNCRDLHHKNIARDVAFWRKLAEGAKRLETSHSIAFVEMVEKMQMLNQTRI